MPVTIWRTGSNPDLSFLTDDIRKQLEISRELLRLGEELEAALGKVNEADLRGALAMAKQEVFRAARALANNANATSSSANTAVSSSIATTSSST